MSDDRVGTSPTKSRGTRVRVISHGHVAVQRAWPLELRLAAITFAMLVVVLLAFGAAAYQGVRASAIGRAVDRLGAIARGWADATARSTANRRAILQSVAASDRVAKALGVAGRTADTLPSDVARALAVGTPPNDSTLLGYAVLTPDGDRRIATFRPLSSRDSATLATVARDAIRAQATIRSALYVVDGEVHYWSAVPIPAREGAARVAGVLAEFRRVKNPERSEEDIRKLIGEETRLYLTSRGSSEWLSVRGVPIPPPMADSVPVGEVRLVSDAQGIPHYVVHAPVVGAPWLIVLAQSEASVLMRPHELLRLFVLIGLVVLTLGTAGVWLLCRRESRPMVQLRDAAHALTHGDYGTRVVPRGGAELVALAESFNEMASAFGTAHTSLAERNAALERANEELVRANDAKARFLAVMSHELRTPLNAIGGYLEILALGIYGPTTSEQQDGFARIKRSQTQLHNLITDVLEYSRLDAGHLTLRREVVSVAEQFAAAAETMADQFARKGVALVVTPTVATVHADASRLQQVVLNLLTNALRFTDEGGTVRLSAESTDAVTHLCVSDSGVGIEEKDRATIFEPFVQVDSSLTRRTGGVGLGLTIVRDLTLAMGGSVRVDSVIGEGSTFIVSLETADSAGRDGVNRIMALGEGMVTPVPDDAPTLA